MNLPKELGKRLKKKSSDITVFDIHPFALFCVFYTCSIFITAIINLWHGVEVNINLHWVILMAVFNGAPVVGIVMIDGIPPLRRVDEKHSLLVTIPMHFVLSAALMQFGVLIWRLIVSAPAITHFNSLITYLQGYTIIIVGAIIIDSRKTARANKNLQKIRESQIIDGGR